MTTIPFWDRQGERIVTHRKAEHWQRAEGKAVDCRLCYRHCHLEKGATGWCKIRQNVGGQLVPTAHGQLGQCQPIYLGYEGGLQVYRPGLRALGIGGLSCTAGCVFCSSGPIALHPDRLPWYGGKPYNVIHSGGNHEAKAMGHPESVVAYAKMIKAGAIVFAANEPLLTFEYTFDLARLAKDAGLDVVLYTNGFSSPAAIAQLAPYVDCVDVGIKGSLDPVFYEKRMRAPGATEHVKASIRAWRDAGVFLVVSDLVAPAHLQADDAWEAASAALWHWLLAECGPDLPFLQGFMLAFPWLKMDTTLYLTPKADPDLQHAAYEARCTQARAGAHAAGLRYTHLLWHDAYPVITCHSCGGVLVEMHPPTVLHDCGYFTPEGCDCWSHDGLVTPDQHCQHCGVAVPIVP